ncbi:MAG TPA: oligosaccharide flippase family protein [Flavitalea sp.]|nr:oligosaccharide flippase family protein [Flavitalea sp.]
MNSKEGLIKNFLSLTLVQVANNILPILVLPFIVRIIGADRYGAINFTAAIVAYFTLFINFAFDLTATRAIVDSKDIETRSNIFSDVLYAKILLLLLSVIIFLLLLNLVPQLSNEKVLFTFTFLYCFSLVITPNWLFQGMQELHIIAICNLASKVMFTICIFFVIRKQDDYVWHPLIYSISSIAVGLFIFFWSIRRYNLKLQGFDIRRVSKLIWSQKTVFFSLVVINLYTIANLIILGLLRTNRDVALYSAGWKLISVVQTFISLPLSLSLFPFIGEHFVLGREQGLNKIKQITPLIIVLTLVSGLLLYIAAPYIIPIFFGTDFYGSIGVFRILCLIPLINSLGNLWGIQAMIHLKMDNALFRITLVAAVFGIVISIVSAIQFGYIGTAWAWILTEAFMAAQMLLYLRFKKIIILNLSYFRYVYLRQNLVNIFSLIRRRFN